MKDLPENQVLDLIFLIDKSGSMYGSEKDTIGGFNSFIQKEKQKDLSTNVTTILFDHEYDVLYKRKSIYEVEELTENEYQVRGSTALLDAIGKTITTLDKEIDNKVLFVIMTDGMENSSIEFSKSQISNMINSHSWEFLFIGADIDSYSEGRGIGIRKSRVANYEKSAGGVEKLYESISDASCCLREDISLDDGEWKKRLREFD
ncbi:vWA domain-containing protein [uncultured Methanobrevibacter sp.]|uniref:vWA domain-containing protein n=1 Tax=uncultured Methanobrevibacter sp. TaxID=253161 RepID=UPI00261ECE62|nr:vWA domain-containing protein [uncultured Methanobrevibacter sp.]